MISAAVLISLTFVAGLALVVTGAPRLRRPRLATRLEPFLRGLQPQPSRLLRQSAEPPLTPFPTAERLLRPLLQEAARLLDRWVGGSASVIQRLRQAGQPENLMRFRVEQVLWALVGLLAAVASSTLIPALIGWSPSALVALGLAIIGVCAGLLGRDRWLTVQLQRRHRRMLGEFPTIADLVCLAVTAGESPQAAIQRVVSRARGELMREFEIALTDLRLGTPLTVAMERLAARVPLTQITRFVDGLAVAIERGTPLADLLRAQASDVRQQHKRALLEAGGKKETLMLVPVVFLILPVVVLFAIYPGFFSLYQLAR